MENNLVASYFHNNKDITQQEFNEILKGLNGQEQWSCNDTSDGGVVTYWAEDSNHDWCIVVLETGGENKQSITRDESFSKSL